MKREPVLQAEYQSKLRQADGTTIDARFQCFDDSMVNFDKPCRLVLTFLNTQLVFTARDFFASLAGIRQELDLLGLVPVVNGAGRSNYPSGMARDMGMGLSVYRLRMGEVMSGDDLVRTFEEDAVDELVTVAEQREFYGQWLRSVLKEV